MPLLFLKNISPICISAVWAISETQEQLWTIFPENASDWQYLQEISHPQKQLEFLASRLLVQDMLKHWQSAYYGIRKDDLKRPDLVNYDFKISLSHSHEYATAIIHQQQAVGIDMELIRPQIARIKSKFLNDEELSFAQDDLSKLTLLWAAKEALYKLYGQKQLIFKTDMYVPAFDLQAINGTTFIQLFPQTPDKQAFELHYEKIGNYWLVYVL
ncbi:MAG: 4'-phosphopantetheinyl transferase superfamily protein [Microscillaceae bacterium]|jgi:phosphopantetheinyl transferase|nr:4'-phosphopantetheinyl transferase superfamily protein [Microscillaceae bacterium]